MISVGTIKIIIGVLLVIIPMYVGWQFESSQHKVVDIAQGNNSIALGFCLGILECILIFALIYI
jgi:hypothetical protein